MLIRDLFERCNIKPNGILHVGAHEGQEASIYKKAGVNSVIWIEGDPDTYTSLVSRLENTGNYVFLNALVSDKIEDVDFNISSNEGQSSSILEFGTHKEQHPNVSFVNRKKLRTTTMKELFKSLNFYLDSDFLVMDIQGMELRALKGMGHLLNQFKWAYLEVNREEVYKGCGLVDEIDTYLSTFGFKRVETKWANRDSGWGDAFYIKD